MTVETDAKGSFSAEDAVNCQIPCALSAITFEIYDSFKKILVEKSKKPQKIKLYEVLTKLVKVKPDFIFAMGRLKDDLMPPIRSLFSQDPKEFDILT